MKLAWTQQNRRKFAKLDYMECPRGASCTFIRLSPRIGMKMYRSQKERDTCHSRQKIAAKHGLAPAVGDKFTIKLSGFGDDENICDDDYTIYTSQNWHGFLTQVVRVAEHDDSRWDDARYDEKIDDLHENLKKLGLGADDLHEGNVGFIGRRLVCIDFDTASMPHCNHKKLRRAKAA